MNLAKLNPYIRSVGTREILYRCEETKAYDARLFYMVSGELSLSVNGERGKLCGGNIIYLPAGTSYKFKGSRFMMICAAFDLTADLCGEEVPPPALSGEFEASKCHTCTIPPFDKPLRLDDADDERESLCEMSALAVSAEGEWRAELSARLKLTLLRLAAATDEHALPARMVKELDSYIRENRRDEISNTEIGAIFGYHPFYVSNKLKEAKGITLRQYIINYRLRAAESLLELTAKSVAEIAEKTGFTDASYFTKCFKATHGVTPKEYRNKFKDVLI